MSFVRNPGFETDTSGWNTSGSGRQSRSPGSAGGHTGGLGGASHEHGDAPRALSRSTTRRTGCRRRRPGTYTGTCGCAPTPPARSLKLRFREYVGSTLVGTATTQVTLTTSWQQVTVAYTVTSPGSTLDFNAYLASADAPPGACFYADDAAIYRG